MPLKQASRQAFDVRYVRKGNTNHWVAYTRRTSGFEGVKAKGAVGYTTSRRQGETEAEEPFAIVTVLLEYDPSLLGPEGNGPSALDQLHERALETADNVFKRHHPDAVVEHKAEEQIYTFPMVRDELNAIMRGHRYDAVVPIEKGLTPIVGNTVSFVEAAYDPFGILVSPANGRSIEVVINKVRDEEHDWAGKRLYYIAWDPKAVTPRVATGSGRRPRDAHAGEPR